MTFDKPKARVKKKNLPDAPEPTKPVEHKDLPGRGRSKQHNSYIQEIRRADSERRTRRELFKDS